MLNFDFLEKDLSIVFLPNFVYDFQRKMFLVLHSIIWPNFIAWVNMCTAIVLLTRLWNDKFWNWPYLFNQAVFLQIKKSRQTFKYPETKTSFKGEIKNIFHQF